MDRDVSLAMIIRQSLVSTCQLPLPSHIQVSKNLSSPTCFDQGSGFMGIDAEPQPESKTSNAESLKKQAMSENILTKAEGHSINY